MAVQGHQPRVPHATRQSRSSRPGRPHHNLSSFAERASAILNHCCRRIGWRKPGCGYGASGRGTKACRFQLPSVLTKPEIDSTESGDSFQTDCAVDAVLGPPMPVKLLHANGHHLARPYLSPLFCDFTKGFSINITFLWYPRLVYIKHGPATPSVTEGRS